MPVRMLDAFDLTGKVAARTRERSEKVAREISDLGGQAVAVDLT